MEKYFQSFTVGSSLVVTIFPLGLLFTASQGKPLDILDWRIVFIVFPLVFGLTNVLTVDILKKRSRAGFALVGAFLGAALSMTGTFGFNVPEIIYGLTGNTRYLALLLGPVLYSLIWAWAMYPVDRSFGFLGSERV